MSRCPVTVHSSVLMHKHAYWHTQTHTHYAQLVISGGSGELNANHPSVVYCVKPALSPLTSSHLSSRLIFFLFQLYVSHSRCQVVTLLFIHSLRPPVLLFSNPSSSSHHSPPLSLSPTTLYFLCYSDSTSLPHLSHTPLSLTEHWLWAVGGAANLSWPLSAVQQAFSISVQAFILINSYYKCNIE